MTDILLALILIVLLAQWAQQNRLGRWLAWKYDEWRRAKRLK